jgi:hypothetical protein
MSDVSDALNEIGIGPLDGSTNVVTPTPVPLYPNNLDPTQVPGGVPSIPGVVSQPITPVIVITPPPVVPTSPETNGEVPTVVSVPSLKHYLEALKSNVEALEKLIG